MLTGIYVYEEGASAEKAIHWFLITNMQISSPEDVEDRIHDYIQRWKIERFHYVLKSGYKICEKQERSYKKLKEIVLLYSVIAMMLKNMLYWVRLYSETPSSVFLEDMEWKLLFRLGNKTRKMPEHAYSVREAIHHIARLGGYKGAPSDFEPGLNVLWIGIERLLFMPEYQSNIV
ncbi:IS4 family transposase [Eisenbergiella sp.]